MIKGGFDGKTRLWMLDDAKWLRRGGGVASWTLIVSIGSRSTTTPLFVATTTLVISYEYLMITTVFRMSRKRKRQQSSQFQFHFLRGHIFKFRESLVSILGSRPVEWNAHEDDN